MERCEATSDNPCQGKTPPPQRPNVSKCELRFGDEISDISRAFANQYNAIATTEFDGCAPCPVVIGQDSDARLVMGGVGASFVKSPGGFGYVLTNSTENECEKPGVMYLKGHDQLIIGVREWLIEREPNAEVLIRIKDQVVSVYVLEGQVSLINQKTGLRIIVPKNHEFLTTFSGSPYQMQLAEYSHESKTWTIKPLPTSSNSSTGCSTVFDPSLDAPISEPVTTIALLAALVIAKLKGVFAS